MDERRLAAVFAVDEDGSSRTSTGYVVAPRLLLTAAHAVESATKVEVQLIDQTAPMPCAVLWNGRAHDLDAAIIEVDARYWPPGTPEEPVRFGRLATMQPGTPAEAIGFPVAQRGPDDELETAHVSGHVNPGDRLLSGYWVLSVTGTSPEDLDPSPWAGMSGAPLYSGNLLCGVVVVDPPHWRHGKLEAVQAHRLLRDEPFSSLLRDRIGYSPVAEAVELEALAEPVTLSRPPRSLPELLRPQAETVRFVGREAQLAEFRAWCDGDGVTTRLLAGPGGQGKTRFAQELGRALAVEGWVVAQLRDSAPPESYRFLGKVSANLLLIMDYADTRPGSVAEVMRVLEEEGNRGAVRVLLIARSAGEWWQHLPASATAHVSMLSGAIVVQLDALADGPAAQRDAYRVALTDLAHGLRRLPDYADADWDAIASALAVPDLADPRLTSPLTLQVRALTDLLAARPGAQPSRPGLVVEALLLEHEERYWSRTASRSAPLRDLGPDQLGDSVAAAALTRAAGKERAAELLASVPSLDDTPERVRTALAAWLGDLYPAGANAYWGGLEPDRLGEFHVSARIGDDGRFLPAFLTVLDTEEAVRALTVLARAAAQPVCPVPDLLDQVATLIVAHPERLAIPAAIVATHSENPGPMIGALTTLASRPDLPADLLEDLNTAFPPQTDSLAEPALKVAESLIRAHRRAVARSFASATTRADLARAYHNYAHRLMGLARWEKAIAAGGHAIAGYQRLARRDPGRYRTSLASSLDNQATALASVGRLEKALKASQRARAVHRALAADDSDAHLLGLARSLSNVSGIFSAFGAHQAALNTSTEAVTILSRLADRKPGLYLPELASARHNQANHFAETDWTVWTGEAVGASEHAVAIRRGLAVQWPDAHLPGLAHSLHNLSIDLKAKQKYAEAAKILDESISVYLRLVLDKRSSYLPHLANALNTKATQFGEEGNLPTAIIAGGRAVLVYLHVARERPAEFLPDLAMALRNHKRLLLEAGLPHPGRWEEFLEQADELILRDPGKGQATTSRALEGDEDFRKRAAKLTLANREYLAEFLHELEAEFLREVGADLQHYFSVTGTEDDTSKLIRQSRFTWLRSRLRRRPRFRMLISGGWYELKRRLHPRYARRRIQSAWQHVAIAARASFLAEARHELKWWLHPRYARQRIQSAWQRLAIAAQGFLLRSERLLHRRQARLSSEPKASIAENLTRARRALSDAVSARERIAYQIKFISTQEALESVGQALTRLHDALLANEDQMRAAISRLQHEVDSSRTQKEDFKATYTAAEAEGIRETMAAISRALHAFGMATRRAQDMTTYMQTRAGAASDALAPKRQDDVTSQQRVDGRDELNPITVNIYAELEWIKREFENDRLDRINADIDAELERLRREVDNNGE